MNFSIRYLTEYTYAGRVTDNLNALRVRPATTSTQRVDDFHVRVDPEARLQRHLDYYGTEVIEFGVAQPHDPLSIDVRPRGAGARAGSPRGRAGRPTRPGRRSRPARMRRRAASSCSPTTTSPRTAP